MLAAAVLLPIRGGLLASDLLAGLGFLRRTLGHHRFIGVLVGLGLELLEHPPQPGPTPGPRTNPTVRAARLVVATGRFGVLVGVLPAAAASARICSATCSAVRFASLEALATIRVPSMATRPGRSSPCRAHTARTCPNNDPIAVSWVARNRAIVAWSGCWFAADHPERHVLGQSPLDPAAGPLTDAVGVDQHGQHHRRVIRCAAPAIGPIPGVEPGQVELGDHIQHEPRQVILRQPVRHRRRHQHQLLAISSHEVVAHAQFSRGTPACRLPHETRSSR